MSFSFKTGKTGKTRKHRQKTRSVSLELETSPKVLEKSDPTQFSDTRKFTFGEAPELDYEAPKPVRHKFDSVPPTMRAEPAAMTRVIGGASPPPPPEMLNTGERRLVRDVARNGMHVVSMYAPPNRILRTLKAGTGLALLGWILYSGGGYVASTFKTHLTSQPSPVAPTITVITPHELPEPAPQAGSAQASKFKVPRMAKVSRAPHLSSRPPVSVEQGVVPAQKPARSPVASRNRSVAMRQPASAPGPRVMDVHVEQTTAARQQAPRAATRTPARVPAKKPVQVAKAKATAQQQQRARIPQRLRSEPKPLNELIQPESASAGAKSR